MQHSIQNTQFANISYKSCNLILILAFSFLAGGNLCAPVPKELGKCGYINELSRDAIDQTLDDYKMLCQQFPRSGRGIDVHCRDVGLEDPSTVAGYGVKDVLQSNGAQEVW